MTKEGDGGFGLQVTCVEGEHYPPTRSAQGTENELVHGAARPHKHRKLTAATSKVSTCRKERPGDETPVATTCNRAIAGKYTYYDEVA
ncbi:hypothetical protein EVC45_42475 [Paraburkholderia sp. UYCP14C]|nr:hypothetical protein EVC45_42475 [Paraburkholderia sp. UYCP14C]